MARRPTIVSTEPSNFQSKVPVTSSLRIHFDIDLDSRFIEGFVYLLDAGGSRIDGRVSYQKKTITFTPKQPLSTGTTYRLHVVGDVDLEDNKQEGIRSIIGDTMAGIYVLTFTTEADEKIAPPSVISPMHQSILRERPIFEWIHAEEAVKYELQISSSNVFSSFLFKEELRGTKIEPDIEIDDGIYYWRIRSIREDGVAGEWSKTFQFNLSTTPQGKIAEGDEDDIDLGYDKYFQNVMMDLEVIESFPKDVAIDIPTNVKSLYFRVIGDVDVTLLNEDSVSLVGRHISNDDEEESHGKVTGRTTVVQAEDGTVYIIFTPDALPTQGGES